MSENFTNRNVSPALKKAIEECHNVEDIRALSLQAAGMVRDREGNVVSVSADAPTVSMPSSAPAPSGRGKCIRIFYPLGNSRFEVYGDSEEDLDRQEAAIRRAIGAPQQ